MVVSPLLEFAFILVFFLCLHGLSCLPDGIIVALFFLSFFLKKKKKDVYMFWSALVFVEYIMVSSSSEVVVCFFCLHGFSFFHWNHCFALNGFLYFLVGFSIFLNRLWCLLRRH